MRPRPRISLLALAFALIAACGDQVREEAVEIDPSRITPPTSATPVAPAPSSAASSPTKPADARTPWLGAHDARTDDTRFLVRWRANREPIPEGESFAIDAWVFDAAHPDTPIDDVALDIDAAMPQHGHGMSRAARVSDTGAGSWRAEGLLFHMAGGWQLAFDVTRGARTDRARAEVVIE